MQNLSCHKFTFWRGEYPDFPSLHVQSPRGPTIDKDPVDVEPQPGTQRIVLGDGKAGCSIGRVVEGGSHRRASHARGEAEHVDEGAADAEGDDCTVGAAINEPDGTLSFTKNVTHHANLPNL